MKRKYNLIREYWSSLVLWLLVFLFYPNRGVSFVVILSILPIIALILSLVNKDKNRFLIYLSITIVLLSIIISGYSYGAYLNT